MKKLLQYISIENLCIWCYAIFGLDTALLAFANPVYSKIYWLLAKATGVFCIPFGLAMLLKQKKISKKNLILFLIPAFYFLVTLLHTYGGFHGHGTIPFMILGCFALFNDELKLKIFKLFFTFVLIQCVFSLILWFAYQWGIGIGFSEVNYYSENQLGARYVKWGIFAIFKGGTNLRLCGIFNEPGALGTLCAFLFIATYSASKLWQKALLLITGMCTYSLAFYILIFMFVACYVLKKSIFNLTWLILLPLLFLQLPNIDFGSERINRFTQRFEISEEKGLEGNNRSSELYDYEFSKLVQNAQIIYGYGVGYPVVTFDTHGTSSYKRYIVDLGFIGFTIFSILWLWGTFLQTKGNKNCLILLLLFFLSVYQRPRALTNLYGYILLFGGILYIQSKSLVTPSLQDNSK